MAIADLVPWNRNRTTPAPRQTEEHPFLALHREMNRLFDDFFRGFDDMMPAFGGGRWGSGWPQVEVQDSGKEYRVAVELPGLEEKDVEVTLAQGALTIRGEKKVETGDGGARYSERY